MNEDLKIWLGISFTAVLATAVVSIQLQAVSRRLDEIDSKYTIVGQQLTSLDTKVQHLDEHLNEVDNKVDNRYVIASQHFETEMKHLDEHIENSARSATVLAREQVDKAEQLAREQVDKIVDAYFALAYRAEGGVTRSLAGDYNCQPPAKCEWGQSISIIQTGDTVRLYNNSGAFVDAKITSNRTLNAGPPLRLGLIMPDGSIQWSNGTSWHKQ
jgi:hypothetical protein